MVELVMLAMGVLLVVAHPPMAEMAVTAQNLEVATVLAAALEVEL